MGSGVAGCCRRDAPRHREAATACQLEEPDMKQRTAGACPVSGKARRALASCVVVVGCSSWGPVFSSFGCGLARIRILSSDGITAGRQTRQPLTGPRSAHRDTAPPHNGPHMTSTRANAFMFSSAVRTKPHGRVARNNHRNSHDAPEPALGAVGGPRSVSCVRCRPVPCGVVALQCHSRGGAFCWGAHAGR